MLRYLGIVIGMLLVLAFGAVSLWLAWPWVMSENMRLTRIELAFTWLAEVGAFIWFVYFLFKFMVTSETDSVFDEDIAYAPGMQILAVVVILAAAVDLGATFFFESRDAARRTTAVEGVCRINKIKKYNLERVFDQQGNVIGDSFCALAWCDVIDEKGKKYPTYYYGKTRRFPSSVHEAIIRDRIGRAPSDMAIVYDATFPRKFWVDGVDGDYMSVWRLSQEITLFAVVFTLLVLATNKALFQTPIPLEICPLIGATLRIGLAGWYMFFHDQTSIPPM